MADLNPRVDDFDKFKVFFEKLNNNHFSQFPPIVETPRCLGLLRSLPIFQGEQFKDDKTVLKYLKDPGKRSSILEQLQKKLKLTRAQQIEIRQTLEKSPVTEVIQEQPSGQGAAVEQPPPAAGTSGGTPAGGMPGIPTFTGPTISSRQPRLVHIIQQTPPPTAMEGGTGQGSAAFSKGGRLDAQRVGAATAKGNIQEARAAIQKEFQSAQSVPQKPAENFATRSSAPRFNFPAFRSKLGNAFKSVQNFASRANPFLKTNLSRIFQGFKNMGGSLLGSLGGFGRGISDPGLTRTANFLGNTGLRGVNAGANFFGGARNQFARIRRVSNKTSSVTKSVKDRKWLLYLLSIIGLMLLTGFTAITSTDQTGTTGGTPIGSSDISQCKFTRGQENPKEASFKSNLLLSYIQEAAQKANIPPVVLAAFIRVESPSSSGMSDDQIVNYSSNCAKSTTGALGIMQIQPPGTTSARGDQASCDDCIDAGAKLVGKTVGTMTTQDYCDPRTNIIVGAGWILKKMSKLGYGDGSKWDPAWTNDREAIKTLVHTYYGAILYPDGNTGPYNYADDVSISIQNCKPSSSGGSHPVAPPIADSALRQAIIDKFGVTMDANFSATQLKWAWEKLWDVSNTKFPGFIKGSTIQATTPGSSERLDCPGKPTITIRLGVSEDVEWFKLVLIHEFGHVIEKCPNSQSNNWAAFQNAFDTEKGITYYAQNANRCTGSNNLSEDYAEMIAYYLNPTTNAQTPRCAPAGSTNPNMKVNFPIHYNVAKNILGDY